MHIQSNRKKVIISLWVLMCSCLLMPAQDMKLLIISHQNFRKPVEQLAEYRTRTGTRTLVVYADQIKTNPGNTDIQNYIRQLNDTAIVPYDHILIVGDYHLLPPFFGVNNSLTDHPYALADTMDFLPDYHVGRISVGTVNECQRVVDKIKNYKRWTASADTLWQSSALVAASDLNMDHDHGAHMKNFLYGQNYDSVYDLRARYHNLMTTNVTKAVDQGVSWVFYIGTGDAKSWHITGGYTNYEVENVIGNTNKLPVIISVGCSNADIDNAQDDCFGESWTKSSVENGAVAFISATETTPFFLSDTLGKHIIFSYFNDSIQTLGEAFSTAKQETYNAFRDTADMEEIEEVLQQFMLLGDPVMQPWTGKALIPKLKIPELAEPGNIQLNVVVTSAGKPVEGALLCLSDKDFKLYRTARTDQSGTHQFNFSFSRQEYIYVSVAKKNMYTLIDSILVSDDDHISGDEKKVITFYDRSNKRLFLESENRISSLMIFSLDGRMLMKWNVNGYRDEVEMSKLSPAVYLLQILYEDGDMKREKILIH